MTAELDRYGGNEWKYGKPTRSHALACSQAHDHTYGICCAASCWCNATPIKLLGIGPTYLSHARHPDCELLGYHPFAECRAVTDPDGNRREIQYWHLNRKGFYPDGSKE